VQFVYVLDDFIPVLDMRLDDFTGLRKAMSDSNGIGFACPTDKAGIAACAVNVLPLDAIRETIPGKNAAANPDAVTIGVYVDAPKPWRSTKRSREVENTRRPLWPRDRPP
jgi:hypothetical protein